MGCCFMYFDGLGMIGWLLMILVGGNSCFFVVWVLDVWGVGVLVGDGVVGFYYFGIDVFFVYIF